MSLQQVKGGLEFLLVKLQSQHLLVESGLFHSDLICILLKAKESLVLLLVDIELRLHLLLQFKTLPSLSLKVPEQLICLPFKGSYLLAELGPFSLALNESRLKLADLLLLSLHDGPLVPSCCDGAHGTLIIAFL